MKKRINSRRDNFVAAALFSRPVHRFTYAANRTRRYVRSRQYRHSERGVTAWIEAEYDVISHCRNHLLLLAD
jgi:hypothetical protein